MSVFDGFCRFLSGEIENGKLIFISLTYFHIFVGFYIYATLLFFISVMHHLKQQHHEPTSDRFYD